MTQKFCPGCACFIKPEEAGINKGGMKTNGRCSITQRIIQRMKECPLVAALLSCECGGRPEMRQHQSGYRMRCQDCGISTKIKPTPMDARRAWITRGEA